MDPIYFFGRCLDSLHLFSLIWFILAELFSQTSFYMVFEFFAVIHDVTGIFAILADAVIFRLPSNPLVGTGSWVFPKYGLLSLLVESCFLLLNGGWLCWELLLCADLYTWFDVILVKVSILDARFLFVSTRLCIWDKLIVSSVFAFLEGLWVSVSFSTIFDVIFVFDFLCWDLLRFWHFSSEFYKEYFWSLWNQVPSK